MSYRVQSIDTSYEAEQAQIKAFRRKGEAGRGDSMLSLTRTTRWLAWNNLLKLRPDCTRQEVALFFLELNYGQVLAREVKIYFENRAKAGNPVKEEKLLISEEILSALIPVVDVFEELGIAYRIGGSVASSVHGIPRATADTDLVANFKAEHVAPFVARLEDMARQGFEYDYYISEAAIREAVARYSSFNLIHQETGHKLDIFILKPDQYNQVEFSRGKLAPLSKTNPHLFWLTTPEDILLHKLDWYRASDNSQKQWLDILGVLKVQENLDFAYLEEWAKNLKLVELLAQAKNEAGISY